jgi:hypothetical protein
MRKLLLFAMVIALAGCATLGSSARITYTPDVQKESSVNIRLFHDLLTAYGGVGHADDAAFPNAKERKLVSIKVILPYSDKGTGSERWTVMHEGNKSAVYEVILVPDGEGSTDFLVTKAK